MLTMTAAQLIEMLKKDGRDPATVQVQFDELPEKQEDVKTAEEIYREALERVQQIGPGHGSVVEAIVGEALNRGRRRSALDNQPTRSQRDQDPAPYNPYHPYTDRERAAIATQWNRQKAIPQPLPTAQSVQHVVSHAPASPTESKEMTPDDWAKLYKCLRLYGRDAGYTAREILDSAFGAKIVRASEARDYMLPAGRVDHFMETAPKCAGDFVMRRRIVVDKTKGGDVTCYVAELMHPELRCDPSPDVVEKAKAKGVPFAYNNHVEHIKSMPTDSMWGTFLYGLFRSCRDSGNTEGLRVGEMWEESWMYSLRLVVKMDGEDEKKTMAKMGNLLRSIEGKNFGGRVLAVTKLSKGCRFRAEPFMNASRDDEADAFDRAWEDD